jgi:hypothetical protein
MFRAVSIHCKSATSHSTVAVSLSMLVSLLDCHSCKYTNVDTVAVIMAGMEFEVQPEAISLVGSFSCVLTHLPDAAKHMPDI